MITKLVKLLSFDLQRTVGISPSADPDWRQLCICPFTLMAFDTKHISKHIDLSSQGTLYATCFPITA